MIIISNLPRDGKGECEDEKISSWTTSRSVGSFEAALLRTNWLPPRYVVTFLVLIYSKVRYCDLHMGFSISVSALHCSVDIRVPPFHGGGREERRVCAYRRSEGNRHAIGARHAFDLLINSAPVPPAPLPCLDPTRRLSYPVGPSGFATNNKL